MTRSPGRLAWLSRKLLISGISAVAVLGGLEIAFRLAGYAPRTEGFQWLADAELQAVPAPDQRTYFCKDDPETGERRLPIRTNRYGQRGEDYPLQKEPGELRIAALGDSLTFGQGVRDDETWPALLEEAMRRDDPPGRRTRVVNAGVNGWTSWHYARWAETRLERFRPDVLVVGLYLGNDMVPKPRSPVLLPARLQNLLRHSALHAFVARLYHEHLWLGMEARRRGTTVEEMEAELARYRGVVDRDPGEFMAEWRDYGVPALDAIRDACREAGVELHVLFLPTHWMTRSAERPPVHETLREVLTGRGFSVATCFDELAAAGAAGEGVWLPWDRGHLTPRGNAIVARAVRDALQDARAARPGG